MQSAPGPSPLAQVLDLVRQNVKGVRIDDTVMPVRLEVTKAGLVPTLSIAAGQAFRLAGIAAQAGEVGTGLRYLLYSAGDQGLIEVVLPPVSGQVPSVSSVIFGADWYEREIEDLYEVVFEGHPLLGDFVLHNEDWPEGVAPMRPDFALSSWLPRPEPQAWRPRRFLESAGAFSMTVGPVFSGVTESIQFRLESEGEEILHASTRPFYKFRGLEKAAEGRSPADAVLLAERLSGTSAVAHAMALAQALERARGVEAPARARALRTILAECERLRSHAAVLEGIADSTGLSVPAALLATEVEALLRLSAEVTGHRYLFGVVVPGGLRRDIATDALQAMADRCEHSARVLTRVAADLGRDNGFLDRVEEVGTLTADEASHLGMVGPVARASGLRGDLRVTHPYAFYDTVTPAEVAETEGDAFARLRVIAAEAQASARLVSEVVRSVPGGGVSVELAPGPGEAFGWTEAPSGPAFHWCRLDAEGRVSRWRILPPSFPNWRAVATAVEHFAFQDFPIILSSFGLSVAEADR